MKQPFYMNRPSRPEKREGWATFVFIGLSIVALLYLIVTSK
jgi:hypothetical protein